MSNCTVAIHNEVPRVAKNAIMGIGDIARDLRHPGIVRMWGNTRDVDLSRTWMLLMQT
jgi:hypothetical protein